MEMAKYIMAILQSNLPVMWSWGVSGIKAIEDGLQFNVHGFLFIGMVQIIYNGGSDLFDVSFIKDGKQVEQIEGVYADNLISAIDNTVEHCENYNERVNQEYSLL